VRFVNEQSQLRAIARVGGDLNTLKALIAYKFPVIIERGAMFEAYDWVGHYQLLVAYDDNQRNFYAFDTFMGTGAAELGVVESYQSLDADWRAFNRTYIVIYNPADESILQTLLGERWNEQESAQIAFDVAQSEARANRQDGFAWFNMGSSLTVLGRYSEAARAFDQARQRELPWRMLWYQFGMFEAYYQTQRYDDVLSLAQSNLTTSAELEESYYWIGRVYEAQGDTAKAASEYQRALNFNSTFQAAREALDSLG
jgi:tetratricopeptide (TPR) repeat protein